MKPETDEPNYEPHIERMIDRADYLRTERKDREWEEKGIFERGRIAAREDIEAGKPWRSPFEFMHEDWRAGYTQEWFSNR